MNENESIGNMGTFDHGEVNKTNGQLLSVGDEIGGYRIVRRLGGGGMGEVYLVENLQMHKIYAMKFLLRSLAKKENLVDRFRVEARVMADLNHPNIVGVYNIGHDKERNLYYLVMEYISPVNNEKIKSENDIDNKSPNSDKWSNTHVSDLEKLLRVKEKKEKSSLNEKDVLRITKQLCSALAYAHNFKGEGVVHRDLKPSNILIDVDKNAHITDFGIARIMEDKYQENIISRRNLTCGYAGTDRSIGEMDTIPLKSDLRVGDFSRKKKTSEKDLQSTNAVTDTGSLIGTYEYMSPEQQEGKSATVKSDIYSLGLIIYRMLVGEKAKGRFDMPSKYGFSKKWDSIIEGCLKKNQNDRFDSTKDIIKILNRTEKRKHYCFMLGIIIVTACIIGYYLTSSTMKEKSYVKGSESNRQSDIGTDEEQKNSAKKEVVVKDVEKFNKVSEEGNSLYREGKKYFSAGQYSEAFKILEQASELGNSESQNLLGTMYLDGKGVPIDYEKAFELFQTAADKNNLSAFNNLGYMYLHGKGIGKNYNKAFKSFMKAAENDDFIAQENIAYMYYNGLSTAKNYDKAFGWYLKAVNNGGSADAQYSLAQMYYYGEGCRKNTENAFKYYKEAADNGNIDGKAQIGWLYYTGEGTTVNYTEAVKYLTEAAEAGIAYAQNNLGWMYQNGYGVKMSSMYQAVKWYKKAADQGNSNAQVNLATYYYGKKEYSEAFRLLKKAANNGNADAQNNLGWMLQNGVGTKKNLREAENWYRKAADQGDETAKANLKNML